MATTPKTGNEPFVAAGRALPFRLADLWRWSSSDLPGNATRAEWDAVDLRTPDGLEIEIKSATYFQVATAGSV